MPKRPYPDFPFPRPSLFRGTGVRCHFLLLSTITSPVSTLNLQMLSASWSQAFLCISVNKLWYRTAGPSNDADQITAITFLLQFSSAYVHEGPFIILNRGLQIFNLNARTQYYMMSNPFCAIGKACLFWTPLRVRSFQTVSA